MKTNSVRYEAWSMQMGSKLADTADTLQDMRNIIDASNARAINLGYKGEQRLIVMVETSREMQDGRFVKGITEETYIETYPQEVIA